MNSAGPSTDGLIAPGGVRRPSAADGFRIFSLLLAAAGFTGCTSLPQPRAEWNEAGTLYTTNTTWARALTPATAEHGRDSGIQFLAHGRDALAARLAVADTAERCLDAQYYIWRPDDSGRLLAERLLRAADRGVRVRMLLDDIGGSATDAVLLTLDSHTNIQVRLFNPVANRHLRNLSLLLDFQRVNRRMHNKSFTADRRVTILGGRNVANHYFAIGDERQFADFDVVAAGPAAAEVAGMFERYWQNPASIPIHAVTPKRHPSPDQLAENQASLAAQVEAMTSSGIFGDLATNNVGVGIRRYEPALVWGPVRLISDLPEKVQTESSDISTHLLPGLREIVRDAQREVFIVSPYFVPGRKGMEFFRSLRARGLRVVVLSNSLAANDVTPVHAGYRRYRKDLLLAGVELWEIKPDVRMRSTADDATKGSDKPAHSALHAKTFAFDRDTLFVGSLNLTRRSSALNTEMGLVVDIPELTGPAVDALEKSLVQNAYRVEFVPGPGPCKECGRIVWVSQEKGREVRYTQEPHASFWRRLQVNIFSLLPLESQL